MKSFCILEQGRSINDPLTLKNKDLFTTEFSDFYRLNWQNDDDPKAFITRQGIVWSEGRSLLYEKVPKIYDYYIFMDDDINFSSDVTNDIPVKIKELLDEYKPIAGTFLDISCWSFPRSIDEKTYYSRKAFPVAGHDLQIQICSKSFADVIFPVWYHGANFSMWYSQWICNKLYPYKQMCFTEIQVSNTRKDEHQSQRKIQYTPGQKLLLNFNRDIKDKSLIMTPNLNTIKEKNILIFNGEVDKTEIEFTLSDLEKIYNINNPNFRNRKSIADKKYILENFWSNVLWLVRLGANKLWNR